MPLAERSAARGGQIMMESLERRRFLSGSISGNVYQDLNANGVRDGVESPGREVPAVFLDANGNKQLDAGEPHRSVRLDGHYHIANVPAGKYRLRTTIYAGAKMLNPDGYS